MKLYSIYIDKINIISFIKLLSTIFNKKIIFKEKKLFILKKKKYLFGNILNLFLKTFNFTSIDQFERINFDTLRDEKGQNIGWKIQCYQSHQFLKECLEIFKIKYSSKIKNIKGFENFLIKRLSSENWPLTNKNILQIMNDINKIILI